MIEFQLSYFKSQKMMLLIHQKNWKTQQWPWDWKRSVFIPVPKKGNVKECSNCSTIALISHTSKVMLKILHNRLQQYMNSELPDVQDGFRKQRSNCQHPLDHQRSNRVPEKNIYFCFTDHTKTLTVWITTNCGKFLKRWEYQITLPTS